MYFFRLQTSMCRPEYADAAQMHARLKPATPANRLARVNCSIVVSPLTYQYNIYIYYHIHYIIKYVGRCHIYNIVYTMLCGVRLSRAWYGYRAHRWGLPWRFTRTQKVRDDLSYSARAICDSTSKRIVNLRARETTGVLRGPDATQSACGRL